MSERLIHHELAPVQPDTIAIKDGRFVGSAGFYTEGSFGDLMPVTVEFDASTSAEPLTPFQYNKPPETVAIGSKPDEKDFTLGEPRGGNIPLTMVAAVMRGPNHLYEFDEGVITAVNTATDGDPAKWETRYFPKNCLPEKTWKEIQVRFNNH